MDQLSVKASSVDINILVVVDTELVKSRNPKQDRPDPNNPVAIPHDGQFMLCTDPRGVISGQGSGDLVFRANAGDHVSLTGTSIYDNSDDAIIIYAVKPIAGQPNVFNTFETVTVTRNRAVMPNSDSPTGNGLPPKQVQLTFADLETRVRQSGNEKFWVCFGLYTLADNGQDQQLYGYFAWDPEIRVPA